MDFLNYETIKKRMSKDFVKLIGKNVLIFDLETTGLAIEKKKFGIGKARWYDPKELDKYETARIVSLAYIYISNFSFEKLDDVQLSDIKYFVRKPKDFKEINNSDVHGITFEYAVSQGEKLGKIMNECLSGILGKCDYVIGHNILFDVNVLLSELWRLEFKDDYKCLENLVDNDKYLCTGVLGEDICTIKSKLPSLGELYEHLCGKDKIEFHNAKNDVYATCKILNEMQIFFCYDESNDFMKIKKMYYFIRINRKKIYDKFNDIDKAQTGYIYTSKFGHTCVSSYELKNAGKAWNDDMDNALFEHIKNGLSDIEIGKIMGRTERSVICRKELLAYKMIDTKSTHDIKKILGLSSSDIIKIKIRFDKKYNSKTNKSLSKNQKSDDKDISSKIKLIEKINELVDKNIQNFKLTGVNIVSPDLIDKLFLINYDK